MFKFANTFASAATLALGVLPMLALAGAAHAAPMSLKVANLETAEGVRAFEQRVDAVAQDFCRAQPPVTGTRVPDTRSCVVAVRAEVMDKLSASQRSQIASVKGATLAAR